MAPKKMLQALVDAEREAAEIVAEANRKAAAVTADAQQDADRLRREFQEQISGKRELVEKTLREESAKRLEESRERVARAHKEIENSFAAHRDEAVGLVVKAIEG